ncbi:AAA family ATPase [Aeoliella sp. ICT_H6.2]|uniref:AAA family ATPase n=1 Tax=Aeoliella straminimaris TaxID=2954799 RepID=A0A9X2F8B2_9BACT|nr:AAA family ATPase [Aeoliella straminimaris]MCO6043508.1 AAA family ATPase [Aeoliella straminimaris]
MTKELIIVGGANGTGKTTFALEYVAQHGVEYLGADAIAAEISSDDPTSARFQAGRRFVTALNERVQGSECLLIESTLSGVALRNGLKRAAQSGFKISIFFLFVDTPETCIERVAQRVRMGGHDVPVEDIRRRFGRSIRNFWNIYREMADSWLVVYNGPEGPLDVVVGSQDEESIRDASWYQTFLQLLMSSNP